MNFWEKPTSPSEWKGEQAVLMIIAGWASLVTVLTSGGEDPVEKQLSERCVRLPLASYLKKSRK